MPIYEYTCNACDNRFEQLVRSMTTAEEGPAVKCPKCGSSKTARALSVFAVGSESPRGAKSSAAAPGMCGRCGGPGPCASGY